MAGIRRLRDEMRREAKKAAALDPATPEMIARAEKLGRQGFFAGKRAPAHDAKIIDMCRNRPHNTMMALMTAWSDGWYAEHRIKTDEELRKMGVITPRMTLAEKAKKTKKKSPSKTAVLKCLRDETGRKLPSDPDELRQVFYGAIDECVGDAE